MSATETVPKTLSIAAEARMAPIRCSSPAWRWHCHADPLFFITWDAIPKQLQAKLRSLDPFPCHRNGGAGPWCGTCPFGTSTTEGGL